MTPILVTVNDAASILALSTKTIYDLAAGGELEKKYVGKGARSFRLTYASVEKYADSLSSDPSAA